jgi:plastocyanin
VPVSARLARLGAVALAAAAAAVGAACSNSEPVHATAPQRGEVTASRGPDGVQSVTIEADDQFRFTPATVHATVGRIHVTLRTVGGTPHNLTFRSLRAAVPTTGRGESRSVDLQVPTPGTYRFLCTIHESLNQTGDLVVTR